MRSIFSWVFQRTGPSLRRKRSPCFSSKLLALLVLLIPPHLLVPRIPHPRHPNPLTIDQIAPERGTDREARQRQQAEPEAQPSRRRNRRRLPERDPPLPRPPRPQRIPTDPQGDRVEQPVHGAQPNTGIDDVAVRARVRQLLVAAVEAAGLVQLPQLREPGRHGRQGGQDAEGVRRVPEAGDIGQQPRAQPAVPLRGAVEDVARVGGGEEGDGEVD
ncbi:hypothetical protein PG984_010364 [Apiospora sp. TS-2023a]